ncbi:MAG TPA: ribonuclease HI family protein [bacterium]|nr:ribonuclease HI family protein [bacterium]HPN34785.1 ribonuclease HI family protein [bacterium]
MTDAAVFQLIVERVTAQHLGIDEAHWRRFCERVKKEWLDKSTAVVRVHIDGGSKGNPGPAGIGIVFSDADGAVLHEHYEYIGEQTNNAAEYHALLKALELAEELGYHALSLHSDSELLVGQISGDYQVKNERLLPLYFRAEEAIRRLRSFSIRAIPRAENKRADRLANLAISRQGR